MEREKRLRSQKEIVMIKFESVIELVNGVRAAELRSWIEEGWVRPEEERGTYVFQEIDVARVRLIANLRRDLAIDREAVPVVLHLLDQLYAMRRRMRALSDAIDAQPAASRKALRKALGVPKTVPVVKLKRNEPGRKSR